VYGRWRRASVNHLLDSSSRFDTSPVVSVHPSVSTVTFETTGPWLSFLQLDATLVWYMLSACVCPSVCLSQAGIVSKRLDESSWFWARRLRSTYPTLCYKEIGVSPKIRVLSTSSGTLSQTLDLENFATASRRYASAVLAMALSVCLSVCLCLSQVGVMSKRLDKSSWVWNGGFLRLILHCVVRKLVHLDT